MSERIILGRSIVEDRWTLAVDGAAAIQAGSRVIVPLARWRAERAALLSAACAVGALLPNTEDVEAIWPDIRDRPLIALHFPIFSDGRALTQAMLLRNRLGFRGELRAVGDVVRDLVFWLGRCGFDAIAPRPDQDLGQCRSALDEIRVVYQAAADAQTPAWTRRRASAA